MKQMGLVLNSKIFLHLWEPVFKIVKEWGTKMDRAKIANVVAFPIMDEIENTIRSVTDAVREQIINTL